MRRGGGKEAGREGEVSNPALLGGRREGEREGGNKSRRTHLAQIAVELTRKTEGAGGAADGGGDEVVEVTVGGGGQLEGAKADVV